MLYKVNSTLDHNCTPAYFGTVSADGGTTWKQITESVDNVDECKSEINKSITRNAYVGQTVWESADIPAGTLIS